MSQEIKLVQSEITQNLSIMKASIDSLHPSTPGEIGHSNRLETVEKLNMLNRKMEQMLTLYKELLRQNEESTSYSLEAMIAIDRGLACGGFDREGSK